MKNVSEMKCSEFSELIKEELIGTAPVWKKLLVISFPVPWLANINESDQFYKLFNKKLKVDDINSKLQDYRIQFISPDKDYMEEGLSKVLLFIRTKEESTFSKYKKMEFDVPEGMLGEFLIGLTDKKENDFNDYMVKPTKIRDLFVCIHASRDICCGITGAPIYKSLKEKFNDHNTSSTRVWRMSHLGGHKYAPNVLDMPRGRLWARFNSSNIDDIFDSNVDLKEVFNYYRGSIGLNSPYEQVFESYVLSDSQNMDYKIISDIEMLNSELAKITMERIEDLDNKKTIFTGFVKLDGYTKSIDCVTGAEKGNTPKYKIDQFEKLA